MIAYCRRNALPVAATFAIFFTIALCSLLFTKVFGRVAAVWPANAFLLVTLLKARPETRLARAAAAWVANVTADLLTGDRVVSAMVLSSLNVAEAGLCVYALQRWVRGALDLSVPRHLLSFIPVALIVPLAAALPASVFIVSQGLGAPAETFFGWWSAKALGLLIFAPAALILSQGAGRELLAPTIVRRTLVMAGVLLAGLSITFLQTRFPFFFLVPPILVLVTFQLGLAGAAWAMLITALFSMVALFNGFGPTMLVANDIGPRVQMLQLFLAFMVVTTLPLAAVLTNRRRLELDLHAERDASRELANALAEARTISQMAEHMAGAGYWVHRPDTGETVWSEQMYTHYGLENDGRVPDFASLLERFHIDDRANVEKFALRSLRTGEEHSLELRLILGGDIKWVMARTRRVTLPDGSVALLGTMVDVSAVHHAEAALVKSEARHRELAISLADARTIARLAEQMAGVGYWTFRPDTGERTWSEEIYTHFGLENDGRVPESSVALERYHPEDRAIAAGFVGETLETGENSRALRLHVEGEIKWVQVRAQRVTTADNSTMFLGTIVDITASRRAEMALAESEVRYRELADSISDVVVRMVEGRLTYVSPSCRQYGYEPGDLIGKALIDFIHPEDRPYVSGRFETNWSANSVGPVVRRGARFRTASGDWVWLEGNPRQIRDADGQVVEVINIYRNVTAQRELEVQLRELRVAAEQAGQVKADFMSNMSHELRTPLTSIIGFAGLLKLGGGLDDRQTMFAERIDKAGKTLLRLVNDILDFSKIEADGVVLESIALDLRDVTDEALALVSAQAEAKGLDLKVDLGSAASPFLGDAVRLHQVLVNLLGNAVKFTDRGQVALTVRKTGKDTLRFAVTDTGAGIAPDRAAEIFDRYTQADGSTTRTHGGTGLGLAICKGLVEAMGGEIGVESVPSQGSTFWFTIRAPEAAQARSVA